MSSEFEAAADEDAEEEVEDEEEEEATIRSERYAIKGAKIGPLRAALDKRGWTEAED